MVERYCALAYSRENMRQSASEIALENLPIPQFTVNKQAQQQAVNKFSLKIGQRVIGLCPGAEFGPAKQWPEQYYAKVANDMAKRGNQVWLFGSQKDKQTCEAILSMIEPEYQQNIRVLAGETTLIEALDLLALCESVVANDSGLMHVAAAVGCNVVAIYGSTSPSYTPPLTQHKQIVHTDIECRPCFKRTCPLGHLECLKRIEPEQVIASIDTLTKNRSVNDII
jgi:heptosyltransferase-2